MCSMRSLMGRTKLTCALIKLANYTFSHIIIFMRIIKMDNQRKKLVIIRIF